MIQTVQTLISKENRNVGLKTNAPPRPEGGIRDGQGKIEKNIHDYIPASNAYVHHYIRKVIKEEKKEEEQEEERRKRRRRRTREKKKKKTNATDIYC